MILGNTTINPHLFALRLLSLHSSYSSGSGLTVKLEFGFWFDFDGSCSGVGLTLK